MKSARIKFLLSMIIVGSVGLFVKSIPYSSSQIALIRGILGCFFVMVFSLLTGQKPDCKSILQNRWTLLFSGIALGVNWILLFEAYRYTTISIATICYYFAPVLVIILSPVILKEKLTVTKVVGIFAALIGLALITGVSTGTGTQDLIGIFYGLGAAAFYATVVFLNKRLTNISGIDSTIVQLGISAIALLPYVLITEKSHISFGNTSSLVLLLIVGVLHTGVVYLLYFSSVQKLPGQSIAALSYIDPVTAILLSTLILREGLTIPQIIGGLLILGATFVNEMLAGRRRKVQPCE